ncbi:unnamed protein product [Kuraishia capsulata CBS 1993]|uniref:PIN domain-containing protein n=1 Tax=Kuraishia capsulata CBS 1993 TaxID=1382522 RepID=W6MTE8_9ASCO|nr:uncharacterized protein KUCA_T00005706001 [Kuraishia capsulata CBS 1993]CDK29713.1 unnamed protein product [Kuraishia capsulata CBS 1993]
MKSTPSLSVIIDPSAFLGGIAVIKKWKSDKVKLVIPEYTLQELDHQKKSRTLTGYNARESVRFIGQALKIPGFLTTQNPKDPGPRWEKCPNFRVRNPTESELVGIIESENRHATSSKLPVTFSEDKALVMKELFNLEENEAGKSNQRYNAKVPSRLKSMLRFCIQKIHIEKTKGNWWILCEDPISTAWYRCFGFQVMSVLETEAYLRNGDCSLEMPSQTSVQHQSFKDVTYESRGRGELWTS